MKPRAASRGFPHFRDETRTLAVPVTSREETAPSPRIGAKVSQFGDLRQFLDRDLTLQVGDKEYRIPAPSAEKGLQMRVNAFSGSMTDADEVIAAVELCGGRWDDEKNEWVKPKGSLFARLMREQDWYTVHRVIKTGLMYYSVSREAAATYWRTGSILGDDSDLEESPQQ